MFMYFSLKAAASVSLSFKSGRRSGRDLTPANFKAEAQMFVSLSLSFLSLLVHHVHTVALLQLECKYVWRLSGGRPHL